MSRHFSLNVWHPFGDRQFWLIRADADWCRTQPSAWVDVIPGWFAVTVGLLGFCVSVTYWPEGKA